MPPDSRSVSFIFHRDTSNTRSTSEDNRSQKNIRRKLQYKFEKDPMDGPKDKDIVERPWHNLSLGQVSTDSKRVLRNGADKISKTISSVRTAFGSVSQKFKSSTRRRQRLEEQQSPINSACKSQTPQSKSRNLLGRTPTKLYSPFGIESPRYAWNKENEIASPASNTSQDLCLENKRHRLFRIPKVNGFCALR
ncbi:uncharacterized protein LOC131673077 [Phymastichus coffea]|uniref:uncharacterized protein LOC131673077 n=1 Tax=Phymastichus coffea TaxID=108790 RepID=UPI00273C4FDB|nr:uncharacterized protein LOC131673077 [Phymastichus coffea]XP_058806753.1 uncharacterized protein LOC131673077 [Phymastichus coffea]XP_058806754.1 uncharacterized protein LOC131673077 [Phymastichus coffea]XP_058806755.1 uncharacterized protein LOC131673077 [Phymastichus coffea]XP_058806756.1 uncharacterized protein LOC131673077 [Phymastichus coffea]XP_058806757.1 uncharacterized protein LOC131673077 [Phymastichus coffea]